VVDAPKVELEYVSVGADDELVEVKLLEAAGARLEVPTELVASIVDVMGTGANNELVNVKLLEAVGIKLELATELVVSVKDVIDAGGTEDESLNLEEVNTGATKLEFALEPVANDDDVDDTAKLITTLVLVGKLEVLKYDAVIATEVADRLDELVAMETFMLVVATTVLVKIELIFEVTDKTLLEVDELFANTEAIAIELVRRVPMIMELEVAGETEVEFVDDVAFGTTSDINRAPQTLP